MKLNSDTANKLIKNLQSEIETLLQAESRDCTYSHTPSESPIIPKYSFAATQDRLEELRGKVAALRHAVNRFNVETRVNGFDLTVDEALGYMSRLNEEKRRLYRLTQIPEVTRTRGYGSKEPDLIHRNFNSDEIQAAYKATCDQLMRIQQAINVANLTVEFDVDIDL